MRARSIAVRVSSTTRTSTVACKTFNSAQAYLFAGPRGTGKTSMARILAKALNCAATPGPSPTADKTCPVRLAIANGSSLDVVEMDAASQRGIDDVREIRERVVLQPVEGRSKIYILDEAHQLTDAATCAGIEDTNRMLVNTRPSPGPSRRGRS